MVMRIPGVAVAAWWMGVAGLASCSPEGSAPPPLAWKLTLLTGDQQRAYVDTRYTIPLTFRVDDPQGRPASGLTVHLRVPETGPTVDFGAWVAEGRLATQGDGSVLVEGPLAGALQGLVEVRVDVEGAGDLGAIRLRNVGPSPQGQVVARMDGRTTVVADVRAVGAEGEPLSNTSLLVALDGCDAPGLVAGTLMVPLDADGRATVRCTPRFASSSVVLEPLEPPGPRVRVRVPSGPLTRAAAFPVEPAHVVPGGVWPPADLLLLKDDREVDLESQVVRVEVLPGPNGAACDFLRGRDVQVAVNAFGALLPDCRGTVEQGPFSLRVTDASGNTAVAAAEVGPGAPERMTTTSLWVMLEEVEGVFLDCRATVLDARGSGLPGRTVQFNVLPESTFECPDEQGAMRTAETNVYGEAVMRPCGPAPAHGTMVVEVVLAGPEGTLTGTCTATR